jgi:hypothetical protein
MSMFDLLPGFLSVTKRFNLITTTTMFDSVIGQVDPLNVLQTHEDFV